MATRETSTTRGQRIILWIIVVLTVLGTIGSFAMIVFANENSKRDQAALAELQKEYQTAVNDRQKKVDEQAAILSGLYYDTLQAYASRVSTFDKGSVTELQKEDLKVGTGEELTESSSFSAYYIGWNPDGKIFDQSIDGDSLKAPIAVEPGAVITGWTEGVAGMKVGGVRQLTIPAEKAYGSSGSGADIAPNTPIRFVIMVITPPEEIPQPEVPAKLLEYYQTGRFSS